MVPPVPGTVTTIRGLLSASGYLDSERSFARQVGVELQAHYVLRVARESRRKDAVGGLDQLRQDARRYQLLVDGVVERLAELDVVEGRHARVESDVGDAEARRRDDQLLVQRLVGIEDPLQVVQAHTGDLDLVVLVHRHRLAAGEVHDNGFYARQVAIVVLVALQHDALANPVLGELEGTGAHGVVDPPAPSARLHDLAVENVGGGIGQLGEEVGLGRVGGYLQGVVVDDLEADDLVCLAVEVLLGAKDVVQVGVGDRRRGVGRGGSLQGPLEVLGRYGLAVVELRVGPQLEGIYSAVFDGPALGDVGHQLEVRVQGDETAEHLRHDARRGRVTGQVRVESGRVGPEPPKSARRQRLGELARLLLEVDGCALRLSLRRGLLGLLFGRRRRHGGRRRRRLGGLLGHFRVAARDGGQRKQRE